VASCTRSGACLRIPRAAIRAQLLQNVQVAAESCGREGVAADEPPARGPIAALLAEVLELLEVHYSFASALKAETGVVGMRLSL
jgi:hypothetical protein